MTYTTGIQCSEAQIAQLLAITSSGAFNAAIRPEHFARAREIHGALASDPSLLINLINSACQQSGQGIEVIKAQVGISTAVTAPAPIYNPAPAVVSGPIYDPAPAPVYVTAPAPVYDPAPAVVTAPVYDPAPAPVYVTAPAPVYNPVPAVATAPVYDPAPTQAYTAERTQYERDRAQYERDLAKWEAEHGDAWRATQGQVQQAAAVVVPASYVPVAQDDVPPLLTTDPKEAKQLGFGRDFWHAVAPGVYQMEHVGWSRVKITGEGPANDRFVEAKPADIVLEYNLGGVVPDGERRGLIEQVRRDNTGAGNHFLPGNNGEVLVDIVGRQYTANGPRYDVVQVGFQPNRDHNFTPSETPTAGPNGGPNVGGPCGGGCGSPNGGGLGV